MGWIQTIINICYRYPKARLKTYARFGGYFQYLAMLHASKKMQRAASNLPPVLSDEAGLPIYFLTGSKHLYQTLFCIRSLVKHTVVKFKFILVDDGSFSDELVETAKRLLPGAEIIRWKAIEAHLDQVLPEDVFVHLRAKRKVYPHIKKLTDIHTLPGEWKLVLDSDMLFQSAPDALVAWLQQPENPLYMLDCQNAYGYSKVLMSRLAGTDIPDLVNVGVIGLNSARIDWRTMDSWVYQLEIQEKASYYLEQALTAMLVATEKSIVLPAADYIVMPDPCSVEQKKGVLHHYVDLSKKVYFTKAWKMI